MKKTTPESSLEKNCPPVSRYEVFDLPAWFYLICLSFLLGIFLITAVALLLNKSKEEANAYEDTIVVVAVNGQVQATTFLTHSLVPSSTVKALSTFYTRPYSTPTASSSFRT
ncbi:hypothetical protein BDF14DRAFT_1881140 [Spinellus fusiger]|nr:hypothetical protein BDF14DRAFT_1881140 [Spinellus fusiger]